MRQCAIKLQNVPYSDRVPLISLLKAKGEHIYETSDITREDYIYTANAVFVYIIANNYWLADNAANYSTLISIPEFIQLYSITFKEL